MRLISYNILDGGIGRADPIAEILEASRADVVVLVEADDHAVVDRIAKRLKMDFVHAMNGKRGGAICSRLPIRDSINHAAGLKKGPKTLLQATIEISPSEMLPMFAVHLHAHAAIADEQERLGELKAVMQVTEELRRSARPHLLCGDFNSNSPVQRLERGRLKPSTQKEMDANGGVIPRDVVARILAAGYLDTFHAVRGEKAAEQGTFSTNHPGQRVDYVFAHGVAASRMADAWIETDRLATFASDHYPIGVELR